MRCAGCHDGQSIIYSTVFSGCMYTCENVCGIRRANCAYAYQCYDTFRGAISASYTSFVSCALFASYFDITYLDIHHIA